MCPSPTEFIRVLVPSSSPTTSPASSLYVYISVLVAQSCPFRNFLSLSLPTFAFASLPWPRAVSPPFFVSQKPNRLTLNPQASHSTLRTFKPKRRPTAAPGMIPRPPGAGPHRQHAHSEAMFPAQGMWGFEVVLFVAFRFLLGMWPLRDAGLQGRGPRIQKFSYRIYNTVRLAWEVLFVCD